MDFESYVVEGENYDDGRPRVVEEHDKYTLSKPVDTFFELMEIEGKSAEEVKKESEFTRESIDEAVKFYAENYEEFNQRFGGNFEYDISDEPELPEPEEPIDHIVDIIEGPFQRGRDMLKEAEDISEEEESSIESIEKGDNSLEAILEPKDGLEGSITLELLDDQVGVSYEIDGSMEEEQQMYADDTKGVEKALRFAFGRYNQLVGENR